MDLRNFSCSYEEYYSFLIPSHMTDVISSLLNSPMIHGGLRYIHSHWFYPRNNFFSTNDFLFLEPLWLPFLSNLPSGCSSTPFSSRLQA